MEHQFRSQASRRSSRGSIASTTSSVGSNLSSVIGNGTMSEDQQEERRRQIKEIMKDKSLTQMEKSKTIQSLMDGRRRSSVCSRSVCSRRNSLNSNCSNTNNNNNNNNNNGRSSQHSQYQSIRAAAAAAAAAFANLDDEDTTMRDDDDNDDTKSISISVASSVTSDQTSANAAAHQMLPAAYLQTKQRKNGGSERRLSLQDFNDSQRTFFAAHQNVLEDAARLQEQSRPPCCHYERNCTLIAPCCGLAFGCRICHDECPDLPPPNTMMQHQQAQEAAAPVAAPPAHHTKMERRRSLPLDNREEEETHHLIDRFAVKEVICRMCYMRQSSKSNLCVNCGVQFGSYHCEICNLWMSDSEAPYHCVDCGFCRVGGRENFRHCDDCGMCIDALLFDDHNCKSGKYMSNCPICQEDLFSSRFASHEMPCGHAIHWHCFKELTSYDTRCPVCKKTAESPEQMAATWSAIAMGIALQPVPPEMARVVNIVCNDCENNDTNRRWHFLGVRCRHCLSFNTNVEQIVQQGREAAQFLDRLEASQATEASGIPANISMPVVRTSQISDANMDRTTSQISDANMDEDLPSALGTSHDSSQMSDSML